MSFDNISQFVFSALLLLSLFSAHGLSLHTCCATGVRYLCFLHKKNIVPLSTEQEAKIKIQSNSI